MCDNDWVSHMSQEHWRAWICPICPLTRFSSPAGLRFHTSSQHTAEVSADRIEAFVRLCGTTDHERSGRRCPLCSAFDTQTLSQYQSHVDHHIEQLASSAFPQSFDEATFSRPRVGALSDPSRNFIRQHSDVEASCSRIYVTGTVADPAIQPEKYQGDSGLSAPKDVGYTSVSKPDLKLASGMAPSMIGSGAEGNAVSWAGERKTEGIISQRLAASSSPSSYKPSQPDTLVNPTSGSASSAAGPLKHQETLDKMLQNSGSVFGRS